MANASKSPPKPGAQSRGPGPARAASAALAPPTASATYNPTARGMRVALGILALALALGVIPVALAGQALHYWNSPLTPPAFPFLTGSISYQPTLAAPQPRVTSAAVQVEATPGGAVTAHLEAGFPVTVHQYATVAGVSWAGITWNGPSSTTGGRGWAPAAQLRAPGGSSAQPIGDPGAFSPALAAAANAGGADFSAWVYFPDKGGYTYRTANATRPLTLGEQIVPLTLVADYGVGLATSQQPLSMRQNLASGDKNALQIIFISLNGAGGLKAYLARYHLTGFDITSAPIPTIDQILSSTASTQDLGLFYDALVTEQMASPPDQSSIFSLLMAANASKSAPFASTSEIGSGALVVTTAQGPNGYTTTVAGRLQPSGGQTIVIAVSSGPQPTAAQSQDAVQAFVQTLLKAAA